MSQYVDGGFKSLTAGGTIAKGAAVKLTAGVLSIAGATEEWIGVTTEAVVSGQVTAVRLRSYGTILMVAGGAFSQGDVVYVVAAVGLVDNIVGTNIRAGIAMEAATALGDVVEVLPC